MKNITLAWHDDHHGIAIGDGWTFFWSHFFHRIFFSKIMKCNKERQKKNVESKIPHLTF